MRSMVYKLGRMSPAARWVLRGGLLVSNALMFCSLLLMIAAGPLTGATYEFHAIAQTMRDTCFGVLFIVIFGSAFIEESSRTHD